MSTEGDDSIHQDTIQNLLRQILVELKLLNATIEAEFGQGIERRDVDDTLRG